MKPKLFRGFISVVFVSLALFGGSQPPANPGNPLEDWLAGMLLGILCDNEYTKHSTPSNSSTPENTTTTAGGVDINNRGQVEDAIQSQTVTGNKNATGGIKPSAVVQIASLKDQGFKAQMAGDQSKAISSFNQALQLVPAPNSETGRWQRSQIYAPIADSWAYLAHKTNNIKDFQTSIENYEMAAELEDGTVFPGGTRRSQLLLQASLVSHYAMIPNKDCALLAKAMQYAPPGSKVYKEISGRQKQFRCK